MSKRLTDLEKANLYLFNLLFRHQVYLEGVKAGLTAHYREMLTELYGEFAKYVGMTRYDTLDQFTRVELERFVRRFQLAQTKYFNQYTAKLIDLLKQFLAVDKHVLTGVYEAATGLTTTERNNAPQPGDKPSTAGLRATHNTEAGNERLWSHIEEQIIPANGVTLNEMLANFEQHSQLVVGNLIRKGYANAESSKDVLFQIVGNQENNYRDGAFATFANANRAIISTAIQYISTLNNAAIASVHFNQYQWVSVLDNKTTEICRSRNGNVYTYGEGPLPPAHYFCRSKDVPLHGDQLHDIPDTFYDWLQTQPADVLTDMLGANLAAQIIAGAPSVKKISINELVIPLTLSQFQSKIDVITVSSIADRG